ncbi:formylmethanofuran dehydrogenase subunit E family protein [candidate division WOR-3 bacterium]|nr:formylmethanofuran dehydrogenase subunit E family protein [candidate division WOR-3 bacterium]
MVDDRLLRAATGFHGHLGPWLALGLRAGLRARQALDAGPFRLRAVVRCPGRTPWSCLLDGVQFGSGCTLGKGNIRHIKARHVSVEFARVEAGSRGRMAGLSPVEARLRLELRPEVWTELNLSTARTEAAVTRLGREIFRRRFDRLFLESRSN